MTTKMERPEFMTDRHLDWMFDLRDDINSVPDRTVTETDRWGDTRVVGGCTTDHAAIWKDAAVWLDEEFDDVTKEQAEAIVAWWVKFYGKGSTCASKEGPSYDIERGIPGRVE